MYIFPLIHTNRNGSIKRMFDIFDIWLVKMGEAESRLLVQVAIFVL